MVLHTLNQTGAVLDSCLRVVAPGDTVLLIEDAVYAACQGHAQLEQLKTCPASIRVLEEDVRARGIDARLDPELPCSDYPGFVTLATDSLRVVSWY